jgi:hypothetical protein
MKHSDIEYLFFYHWVVSTGIVCGLEHPLEWALNALRTPGGTLSEEEQAKTRKYLPVFLVEMFEDFYQKNAESSKEILDWFRGHYKTTIFEHYFDSFQDPIDKVINSNRSKFVDYLIPMSTE